MPVTLSNDRIRLFQNAKYSIYTFLALQANRTDASPAQSLNADIFETNWKITNADLANELVRMEKADILKYTIASMSVKWDKLRTSPFTETQLLERFSESIDQQRSFIFDARLIDKASSAPTSVTQPITVTTFCDRWKTSKDILFSVLGQLQSRELLTVDLADVTITWLI